ncbi:hypothetical protein D043_0516A, partial [Vibrio parahaemolyticus EKP-021]
MIVVDISV